MIANRCPLEGSSGWVQRAGFVSRASQCIVEIFTFLYSGGSMDRVELLSLLSHLDSKGDHTALLRHMQGFDASKAECFKKSDKSHILGVIETAFGSVHEFTRIVRRAFATSDGLARLGAIVTLELDTIKVEDAESV